MFERWGINLQTKIASDRGEMKRNTLCSGRDFYLWRWGSTVQPFNGRKAETDKASGEVRRGKMGQGGEKLTWSSGVSF